MLMGQIKVVLIFNEEDDRQREAGEYLKTKKRCKTALVTELIHAWLKNKGEENYPEYSKGNVEISDIKRELLKDKDFLMQIEKSIAGAGSEEIVEAESEKSEDLDMDEDLMLAGLSMFETDM